MVKDPVCGMGVEEDDPATVIKVMNGQKHYFCCTDCMLLFNQDPDEYIRAIPKNPARDLVCGMEIDAANPPYTAIFEGKIFYFCSSSCLIYFDASPKRFMEGTHVRD